jgi:ABC-type lipoprotein export system ATPase subunit
MIGIVLQSHYLSPKLTAIENVVLPMLAGNTKRIDRPQRAEELLSLVGLSERMKSFPEEMSGGEQQRACIARALVNDPRIILADEPTGNLDNNNQQKVFRILKKFAEKGRCVVIISHAKEIANYADVMLTMQHGRLKEVGMNVETGS